MAGPFIPAGGAGIPFGQSAFGGAHDQAVGALLYRLIFGPTSKPGDGSAHATWESFNPTTPSGVANTLSMLFGGGDFTGLSGEELPNPGMPGRYEPYNQAKAQASSQVKFREGQPYDVTSHVQAVRDLVQRLNEGHGPDKLQHMQDYMKARIVQHQQAIHDALFGGEVHAKGPIPKPLEVHQLLLHARNSRH